MSSHREYQSFDGRGNNLLHPDWGAAGEPLLRATPIHYADRISSPAARTPSPRVVSNRIHREDPTGKRPNSHGASDMVWAFGQFVDHEIDLTEAVEELVDLEIPPGDLEFDPTLVIRTRRSRFVAGTGAGLGNPRQQVNQISAFLDGTNVYGSDDQRSRALRRLDGSGKLATVPNPTHGPLLPKNVFGLPNAPDSTQKWFLAGDVRANEHAVLTSMHTLFVREHNRLCDELVAAYPWLDGDDEELFQRARQLVIGILQAIAYNEFLPAVLGAGAIDRHRKYGAGIQPGIDNLFSTACYRLGHSMLSSELSLADGTKLRLKDAFFDPSQVETRGIEAFLGGLGKQRMQEVDRFAVEDVRSFLFGSPANGQPLDLAALNIFRGRDHGLPDYNTCRRSFGLPAKRSFAEISPDPETQIALADTYSSVDAIDPWVGGLCEPSLPGALVGELVATVLVDQFTRLRAADRFFYEWNPNLTAEERLYVHKTRLSHVIARNTSLSVSGNLFFVAGAALPPEPEVLGLDEPGDPLPFAVAAGRGR